MKPVKRASFKCPPNRRLKRIKDTSDGCDTLRARSDRYTTESSREAPQQAAIGDGSFDPVHPHCPSIVDSRLSPTVPFQQHVNQTHSGSAVMNLSPAEHIRLSHPGSSSKAIKGVRKRKALKPSPQAPIQCGQGVKLSDLWSERTLHDYAPAHVQQTFDVATENILNGSSGSFPTDFEIWSHSSAGQELPVPAALEVGFDGEFTFDPPYDTLASLESSAYTPKDQPNRALEQNAAFSPQNTENICIGSGDKVANTNSQVSENRKRAIKSQDALKGIGSHFDTGLPCMISALKILLALHIPRPACLSACDKYAIASARQPRLIDSCLASNKKSFQLISEMLRCSCSLNSQMQLVLTVISSKLMAWYRTAVRNDDDSTDDWSSREQSDVTSKINCSDYTERVLHQPITIGDYVVVNPALSAKLRAQLVASELRKVESLVRSLSRRIQQSSLGRLDSDAFTKSQISSAAKSESTTWDEAGQAKVIHGALSAFLHKNLQAANAEVNY